MIRKQKKVVSILVVLEIDFKAFNKSDGLAVALLKEQGHEIIAISGRYVKATEQRLAKWEIPYYQAETKLEIAKQLFDFEFGQYNAILNGKYKDYSLVVLGNDINDIPLFELTYNSFAPKNAILYLSRHSIIHSIIKLNSNGGEGCLWELASKFSLLPITKGN